MYKTQKMVAEIVFGKVTKHQSDIGFHKKFCLQRWDQLFTEWHALTHTFRGGCYLPSSLYQVSVSEEQRKKNLAKIDASRSSQTITPMSAHSQ